MKDVVISRPAEERGARIETTVRLDTALTVGVAPQKNAGRGLKLSFAGFSRADSGRRPAEERGARIETSNLRQPPATDTGRPAEERGARIETSFLGRHHGTESSPRRRTRGAD